MLVYLLACTTFHDIWFHAEDQAPNRDSVETVGTDCSWFDDPANCWNDAATVAAKCVPDSGRVGILVPEPSKDTGAEPTYLNCAYDDTNPVADYQVQFHSPITLPVAGSTLDFTVFAPEATNCASASFDNDTDFGFAVEGVGTFS